MSEDRYPRGFAWERAKIEAEMRRAGMHRGSVALLVALVYSKCGYHQALAFLNRVVQDRIR